MKKKTKKKIIYFFRRIFLLIIVCGIIYIGYIFFSSDSKDEIGPQINSRDTVTTNVGKSVNLLSNVSAVDDVDGAVDVSVEGNYSFDKAGEYNLYYVAKDKSGNVTKRAFKLFVIDNKSNLVEEPKNESNKVEFTTSKGFKGYTENGRTYIDGLLIVNKTYSIDKDFNPVKLNGDAEAASNLMFEAAKKEKGYNMWVQSGFRSYSTQERLYKNYVNNYGQTSADRFSARPGHSEHQTGLAFDVCATNRPCISSDFDNTPEAKWLSDNCYKYGFILRFVKGKENETGYMHESWHFRYVGKELAQKLYNNGDWITLEDYLGITSEYKN